LDDEELISRASVALNAGCDNFTCASGAYRPAAMATGVTIGRDRTSVYVLLGGAKLFVKALLISIAVDAILFALWWWLMK
jgi:hypothetical protein